MLAFLGDSSSVMWQLFCSIFWNVEDIFYITNVLNTSVTETLQRVVSEGFSLFFFHKRKIFLKIVLISLIGASEKAMAPHSSTLAWKVPWTEEPGGLQSMGSLESDTTERLHFHFSLSCTGEGNGNPLQCSCLENPRNGGAWWAAVSGVAQSRPRLKRLSSSSSRWR